MTTLHIDFETRSELDLKEVGLHRYARHPSTDVWCMAYAFGDDEPVIWTPGMSLPMGMTVRVHEGAAVAAWNVAFELEIWNEILVKRYGFPALKPEQAHCTMAQSYAMGLPGALDDASYATGVQLQKDKEGHALMLRMCRPRSKAGVTPVVWWNEPEKLQRLYDYCKQDVRVERAVGQRLMPLSAKERRVFLLDYKINQRGVQLDMESVRGAIAMAEQVKAACDAEMSVITGGAVTSVTAVIAMKEWMAAQGVETKSIAKQAIVDLLNQGSDVAPDDTLPAPVRKALLLRQEAGKASAAKFDVMQDRAGEDGRLRGSYQYHGAASGRWAARGVQVHNLPRNMPKPETVEQILALVRQGNWRAIDVVYGPPLTMLSQCLRSFFVAPAGKRLVSGDWSNVESRGGAWFCGEEWKLKAFREQDAGTGSDVYRLGASRLLGIPVEEVTDEQRQGYGKVPDLAFMYQGGIGSGKTMGKTYGVIATDKEWDERKNKWRDSHPRIKAMWPAIQWAAITAVQNPGAKYTVGLPGREAAFLMAGSFLWCLLPSGRTICFPYPKILEGDFGPQLTYMCVPSPDDRKKMKVIHDAANGPNWVRIGTYGGALFNRIVQGFCRDFLADCALALDDAGAALVLHTHDDLNIEVSTAAAEGARRAMEAMMRAVPAWAAGFPLFAKCNVMERYGK